MKVFEVQGASAIKLWADSEETAQRIAEELGFPLGVPTDISYPRLAVHAYGEPLNGPGWGICSSEAKALMFLETLGITGVDIVKAPRKRHEKRPGKLSKELLAKEFRALVIHARKSLGWTQEDLAFKVGCLRQAVNSFESGRTVPHALEGIIRAVGLDPEMSKEEISSLKTALDI